LPPPTPRLFPYTTLFRSKALTRDQFGRRTNPLDPDQSLVLLKSSALLAHEGGKRFATNSWEYQTLREWIAAGTLADSTDTPRLRSEEHTSELQSRFDLVY